jgi:hypothetical protein
MDEAFFSVPYPQGLLTLLPRHDQMEASCQGVEIGEGWTVVTVVAQARVRSTTWRAFTRRSVASGVLEPTCEESSSTTRVVIGGPRQSPHALPESRPGYLQLLE